MQTFLLATPVPLIVGHTKQKAAAPVPTMIELFGQAHVAVMGFQVSAFETQLQAKVPVLARVNAVTLLQVKQENLVPEGTIAAVAPQSQKPLGFHVKPVVLHVHELLFVLTTFTLVKVLEAPQVRHEPFVSSIIPAIVLQEMHEPEVAEIVHIDEDGQTQLPFPLLGAVTGQVKHREPAKKAFVMSQMQLPPL